MELLPKSGERLWIDGSQAEFNRRNQECLDFELREAAERLREAGYVHLKQCVAKNLINDSITAYGSWCSAHEELSTKLRSDGRRPRIVNLHSSQIVLKRLMTRSTRLLEVLDYLFGYRTSIYTSLTFQFGTEQPLHIDTPVFRTEPDGFYFGVWVALEDADTQNGALFALKGAHKGTLINPLLFARENGDNLKELIPEDPYLWSPYQDAVVKKCKEEGYKEVLIQAKKGDVVIWHPSLPHGGSRINDPNQSRLSIVFHVTPENVPVYQADVFFGVKPPPSRISQFEYNDYEGRRFVVNPTVIGKN